MKYLRQVNAKNCRQYFFNEMINIKNIDPSFSDIDRYHLKVLIMSFITLSVLQ